VYTIRRRWRLPAARIHYISNADVLARHWSAVHGHLLRRHGTPVAEADSRLLASVRIPGSVRKEMSIPRLFRSSRLRPERITDLYSEQILFTTL
jgi:hypothetical protein